MPAAGLGVVGMKIMGEGRLRNDDERRDAPVWFALTLGCVDVLNVGCERTAEVEGHRCPSVDQIRVG